MKKTRHICLIVEEKGMGQLENEFCGFWHRLVDQERYEP